MFSGYKTIVVGVLSMLAGLSTMMGVTLDPETVAVISNNIDVVIGGGMLLYGAVMSVLRAFTESPMFKSPK